MLRIGLGIISLYLSFRQGIGIDIEYNEEIRHTMIFDNGEEETVAFVGIIIKLPLFQIYIGDYYELKGLA